MNPFTYIPDHLCKALFRYFSNKSLSDLIKVSKPMGAQATEEAYRRHYGHSIAITGRCVDPSWVDVSTERGAYFFLARPGTERLKLKHAVLSEDPDMIQLALETGATDYLAGCISAAKRGIYDMTIEMFEKTDKGNIPKCLSAAYQGGNRDLINYFTALETPDWNSAMKGACKGGWLAFIYELFDKFTGTPEDLIEYCRPCMWIVETLIETKNMVITDDYPLACAIADYNCDTADYLINKFPNLDTTYSFKTACANGRERYVKKLLPSTQFEIHRGFRMACKYGQDSIMTLLAEKIPVDWNAAVEDVCKFKGYNQVDRLSTLVLCARNGASLEVIRETLREERSGCFTDCVEMLTRAESN
jgi:hypothetical protein